MLPSLFNDPPRPLRVNSASALADAIAGFSEFGAASLKASTPYTAPDGTRGEIDAFINEFWTSKQRDANGLHEVSYRACFKPQLPRFFIERLTRPGDVVYDPFMGRGTTPLEAALLGRVPWGNDINPLSRMLIRPRLNPLTIEEIAARLGEIDFKNCDELPEDLLVFYHPETLREISALKQHLIEREREGQLDAVDDWIRMVAVNRLTGHSPGFFSVYSMPPNQAVSLVAQRKINAERNQTPPRRSVPGLILKKSKSLLKDLDAPARRRLRAIAKKSRLLASPADATKKLRANSVQLVVTSPPFLNVVDYATDNWLRCWFCGIDPKSLALTVPTKVEDWSAAMASVFRELARVLAPGGHVAFEVGEVNKGRVRLEELVIPCGSAAGLAPLLVMINAQEFTKTANCWGVANNAKGTNTNRIVLFRKA